MADNYTGHSDKVREQATEDLFNRDAAPKHSKKDEAEELGAGLQSRNSEELFLQSILEGSRDGTISYNDDKSDASAAGVADMSVPTLETVAYKDESEKIPDLVADISVERDESASDQSGFEVESGDPGKAGISFDSVFGNNLESGLNQAGHTQQSQPVEPQMAFGTQVDSGLQPSSAEVVEDAPALKKTPSDSEINYSPDDISISAAGIVEGTEGGTLVATVTGSDQNAGEVLSYSIESDPSGIFELVGNQLFLKENVNIDYEVSQTHSVALQVTDEIGNSFTKVFYIEVEDINETPVLDVVSSVTVAEDGSTVISFSATDVDSGDSAHTSASADNGTVAVDADSGEITYTPTANFNGSDTITVTTTDNDGAQVVKTVSVTVNDVNDAPTLSVVSTATVDEDGSKTISFTAADVDGTVSTAAAADHGTVAVDEDSGEITYQPDADYFGSDTITLTTTDDDGAVAVKAVAVTVNGIDDSAEAPTLSASVGESEIVHAVVEESLSIDNPSFEAASLADGGWNLSTQGWQQQQGYSGTFNPADVHLQGGASDGENSAFLVRNASISQEIDTTLESGKSYSLQVDVGDRGDMDSPPDYQINLYAGDQLIGSVTEADFPATENAFITATVTVNANSLADDFAGFGENLRIELVNDSSLQTNFDDVRLTMSEPGAPETIRYPININAELTDTDGSETLSIQVGGLPEGAVLSAGSDNGDGSWTLDPAETDGLTVTVPVASGDFTLAISATSTESLGGESTTVTAPLSVEIPTLDTSADAPILNVSVGEAEINCEINQESIIVDNFSFEDNALANGSATRSIQDWVKTGVNGTFDPSNRSFGEGASDGENTGWVNKNSSISQEVDATLESGKSYTLQVDIGDRGDIANVPDYEIRLYAGDQLLGSASQDEFPTKDDGFVTATLSIDTEALADDFSGFGENLRIELYNGSSIQTNFDNVRLSEGTPGEAQSLSYAIDIDAALVDTDGSESLSITVEGLPAGAVLSAGTDNGDGSWTLSSDDTEGLTATVPLNVGDFTLSVSAIATEALGHLGEAGDGTSVENMSISVADLNITPTLDLAAALSVDEDTAGEVTFSAADVDGSVVTAAVANSGTVTVDENNGEITYTPTANFNGSDTITVTTTDNDGVQVVKTVSVTVNDINDAPTLEVVSTATVDEDGSKTISFAANDVDGLVSTTATSNHGTVTVDESSGEITYTPDGNFNGNDTITVTTTDDDGASLVKTVGVTVSEVNDAPIDISFSGDTVTENAAGGTVVANLSASDIDTGDTHNFEITSDASGLFEVLDGQLLVKEGADVDYETDTSHQVTIQVTDRAGDSYSETLTINVVNIEETPASINLTGTSGNDHLVGADGNDSLDGGRGDDTLEGGAGDDTFKVYGDAGTDQYDGGEGHDVIQGTRSNDVIRVADNLENIQNIEAIDGGDGYDVLQAGSGDDTIDLSAAPALNGIEEIDGGYGNDHITGTSGSDHIEGNRGDDTIVGGAGDDSVSGGSGNDTYIFNPFEGNDTFQGGDGGGWTDTVQLNANADPDADPENPWTIAIDGDQVQYDLAAHALELNPDTSGVITLSDGSELTFDGIERIEW